MKRLLLQFDTSPLPSSFDQVVAYDGGADRIMSYGNATEASVRDLVHGAIFTRGPKDLHNTAIFIGGTDMAAGERLLATVQKTMFGPMRVSVLLDSNGSNTTAVAAVVIHGDEVVYAEEGDLVHKPRDQWHTFWNAGDEPCRILEIIAQPGFEHFFNELGDAMAAANAPNPGVVLANSDLPQRYAIEFQPERIADICQTYGLRFPGVID